MQRSSHSHVAYVIVICCCTSSVRCIYIEIYLFLSNCTFVGEHIYY
jgi:hypothetical protein